MGRAPTLVTLTEQERVRAWLGRPSPSPRAGRCPSTRCDACNVSYGWRPSGRRSGTSMPCTTGSSGVTSWRRRGSGSAAIGERPGSIARLWPTWRHMGWSGCSWNSRMFSEQAGTARRQLGQGRYRNQAAASGGWAYRRSGTGWCNRRPSWCWSRSSRRTSCPRRTVSGQDVRPPKRWSASEWAFHAATFGFWNVTSATSSARSTTRGCSRPWPSGCPTGGCSS